MFDNLKGMAGLMKDLPRIKQKMEEVKDHLEKVIVEAETGGGAVRARANGQLKLIGLEIDPALMSALVEVTNPDDRTMAEDLVIGAVNAVMTKAREEAEKEMSIAMQDLGLALPPGGLGGLLGA